MVDWQDVDVTGRPFEGLGPATTAAPVQWAVQRMSGQEGVALVVPSGYDVYARLLHPLGGDERWSEVAPEYLAPGSGRYPYPFPETLMQVEGDMGAALVDALLPSLTAATCCPVPVPLWTLGRLG